MGVDRVDEPCRRWHPAVPPPVSIPWVVCAGLCWLIASLADSRPVMVAVAAATAVSALAVRYPWVAVATSAVALSATLSVAKVEPLDSGEVTLEGTMTTDIISGPYGPWAMMTTDEGPVLVDLDSEHEVSRGDRIRVEGSSSGRPGVARGQPHRGAVRVRELEVLAPSSSPLLVAGTVVRDRVIERSPPTSPGRALLTGFMIGDTSGLDPVDMAAMRKAGLAHFTAVSGRNVALFLGLLFLAAGPLGFDSRRRAVVGLVGLPIYAAATAFTPSVLRASVMAAVALAGRLLGIVLETWQLLALAVVLLMVADPGFTSSVGLQLSAAGTAGVLMGARWPLRHGMVRRALAVSLGAQIAVTPLLLLHFGEVPLGSPLANLLAAPLVAAATLVGAVGVAGPGALVGVAAWLCELVLMLARSVATWPQLHVTGVVVAVAAGVLAVRLRPLRGVIALAGACFLVVALAAPLTRLPATGAMVLDVGQGDAILLVGGDNRFAMFDAGPNPTLTHDKLTQHGVGSLELVILSHVHADHIEGLLGVVGRVPIGKVWAAFEPHETASSRAVLSALAEHGVPVETPQVGATHQLGELRLEVLGPIRRYASTNDQSIVVMVHGPERRMLLTGDIEGVAQTDLMGVTADVLQVPHHGSATSDPEWLSQVGADLAFISLGAENRLGHPADVVVETLVATGATVLRTDLNGDLRVDLDGRGSLASVGPGKTFGENTKQYQRDAWLGLQQFCEVVPSDRQTRDIGYGVHSGGAGVVG